MGGGSWGTALANLLAHRGYTINLWVFEKEVKDQILETGENKIFLPNVKLPANLHPTNDLAETVLDKNMVVDGLGLGLNARAALITRGMTEIRRLGLKMGANPRTFTGLAGIGDLILTCTGDLSRNHTVGVKLGQGNKISDILAEMRMVAEGVKTARSVYNLSRKLGVDMPIFHEAYRILYEDFSPKEAIYRLMTRDLKQDLDEF